MLILQDSNMRIRDNPSYYRAAAVLCQKERAAAARCIMSKKSNNLFDFSSLSFDLGFSDVESEKEREFIRAACLNRQPVMFERAVDMVTALDITQNYFCLVSGSFIFGDFIEALCYVHDLKPRTIYLTTLGMSFDNADSIVNLVDYLGCQHVNLIVSNYFVAKERHNMVEYIVQEFTGKPISVAVLASHCKIALIESDKGNIVITGSANLSSSNNVEQFEFIHDDIIFEYIKSLLDSIIEKYTVIDGAAGKTIFNNNTNNTGRKAWDHVKKGVERWQAAEADGAVRPKKDKNSPQQNSAEICTQTET